MKKLLMLLGVMQLFWLPGIVFAQTAKVVDVQGEVLVKNTVSASWDAAKINMLLSKDAEIQTKAGARCTMAFDEELKNILTVQENSHIKLDNIKPGNVFLSQGRVFSLIKNLPKTEKFQIRTPTAIAGARGTGWSTSFENGKTAAFVFEDRVLIEGTNDLGEPICEKEIDNGYGIEISRGCVMGDVFPLDDAHKREWNGFVNNIQVIVEGFRPPGGDEPDDNPPGIERERPASRI